MHSSWDHVGWLIDRVVSRWRAVCVYRRASPRICLTVDEGESAIANIVATIGVDGAYIGRSYDVESVFADGALIIQIDGPGYQR